MINAIWTFVGDKDNKRLVWLALDVETREMVGVHVGDRSEQGARALWASLPGVYRQCAVADTDFWRAYALVFPDKRHKAGGKRPARLVILSASTVRCANASHD
jgi:insertion element IS1 protein InsB